MTISGPYKAPPGMLDKLGYIGVSKLIVEKYTFKVLKVNPLTGALTANPVGLFIFGFTGGPGLAKCQGLYCDGDGDGFADFFYEKVMECRNAN
jgi:hypothetical protein